MVEQVITEMAFRALSIMGGSGIAGFCMGYAVKKLLKIMAIVGGAIIAIIGLLEYKGMISVNWNTVSHESYNVANQTLQTVSQVAQHVGTQMDSSSTGMIAAGGVGSFALCFIYGLKKG